MATPAVRSSALSLYRSYLRTAAALPRLQVRVSSRRAVRMAFRARAYDYLALLGGDGGTAGADAAAEVWIREGREDLGMFLGPSPPVCRPPRISCGCIECGERY